MLALVIAIFAAAWLINAEEDNTNYQLYGSVVFARTGERTAELDDSGPRILTSLGANQLFSLGEAFRGRYINSFHGHIGLGQQPIYELAPNVVDNDQLYILTPDSPFLVASAQAFMQGFYPPFTLNESAALMLNPANILANRTYVDYPLSGYQYPQIETASDLDPMSVWVDGSGNCPNVDLSGDEYYDTEEFQVTRKQSKAMYLATGFATKLQNVLVESQFDYDNAYLIYDYINYLYTHDTATFELFTENETFNGVYDELRFLADQQQWALYGNSTADNQIRVMAGKTLAARTLGQFQELVGSMGESPKLSLFVTEYEPFVSFFSLAELEFLNTNFFGLPEYGSAMVFELFSLGNSDTAFPTDESDLWVRFHFHNGTDFPEGDSLQAFPLFGRGPSETDMPWLDFQDMMSRIMTSTIVDWCNDCAAITLFCAAFDSNETIIIGPNATAAAHHAMTPQVAGVIGAAVTLAVLLKAVFLAMLLGRIRFHKSPRRSRKADLGGFKGAAKLGSDADLSLPKNGAVAGIVSMGDGDRDRKEQPKERVNSWELRAKEDGKDLGDGGFSRRESLDDDVEAFAKPVAPDERV